MAGDVLLLVVWWSIIRVFEILLFPRCFIFAVYLTFLPFFCLGCALEIITVTIEITFLS
jgi:hypothetical protein